MTSKAEVYMGGRFDPVYLDTYAEICAAISGYGTDRQVARLPDQMIYDNPKTGIKVEILRSN